MRKACNFVFDCLQGNVCTPLHDQAELRATVVLPKVKLESRKSFYFSGATIFNSLPLKTRKLAVGFYLVFKRIIFIG